MDWTVPSSLSEKPDNFILGLLSIFSSSSGVLFLCQLLRERERRGKSQTRLGFNLHGERGITVQKISARIGRNNFCVRGNPTIGVIYYARRTDSSRLADHPPARVKYSWSACEEGGICACARRVQWQKVKSWRHEGRMQAYALPLYWDFYFYILWHWWIREKVSTRSFLLHFSSRALPAAPSVNARDLQTVQSSFARGCATDEKWSSATVDGYASEPITNPHASFW